MARRALSIVPLQQALFEQTGPQTIARMQPAYGSLWAALYLPQLSLEVLTSTAADSPCLVAQSQGGQPLVQAVSGAARSYGVIPGMTVTEAYALCSELVVVPRDQAAEQDALQQLAQWAGQYTSMVSLEPDAVLLELAGSLCLFGGLDELLARLRRDSAAQNYTMIMALAPTPQAALLLVRCGEDGVVTDTQALRAELGRLPVSALPFSDKQAALAMRLGLRTLRDLWRLPGDGLAKRFGTGFVEYLDRLLGHKPEPRLAYQSAVTFSKRWPFPMETNKLCFIFHGLEQLVARLVRFMRLRALSLNRLELLFYHSQHPLSRMELRTQQLCHQADHLLMLLRERLEREPLPAAALEMELVVNEFHDFVTEPQSMFADDNQQDDPQWQQFLDKLHTRLGAGAVSHLQVLDEHRPERAWDNGIALPVDPKQRRPVWLLPQPQRLSNKLRDIQLLSGPERIESGWWDGFDIRRDYYRGLDRQGRRLWLFQDLTERHWYLHGMFA